MANYNVNLKKNKAFVAFLKSLKPGWAEEGGKVVLIDGQFHCRTKWLPHEEWWQMYVQGDRGHLKETEIAEFAAVIAAGEDCQLTVSALRFLSFIVDYYAVMTGKRALKISPAAEKQLVAESRTALLALAEYCVNNNVNTRKMRVLSASDDVVVAVIAGEYLDFNRSGLIKVPAKSVSRLAALPADLDCPF